jgi:ComF family protein
VCWRCGRPNAGGRTCLDCSSYTALDGVSIAARYEGGVKDLILQLKFHRARAAARTAAVLVLAALPDDPAAEVVTAVPVSPARHRERGYNQSELIAKHVAAHLDLPFRRLLGRSGSAHQLGMNRQARLRQVSGAFFVVRPVTGQRVLVVDDVITTGATLAECASVLQTAGADEVRGAVVARH